MPDITGQVLGVTGQQTSRGIIYKIAFSDGVEYATFENPLAQKANGLAGTGDVSARVNSSPSKDGRFTNHYLNDIAPLGQLPPEDLMNQAGNEVGGIPIQQSGGKRGGGGGRGMTEADKTRITILASFGQAVDLVGSLYSAAGPEALEEAWTHVEDVAGRIYTKARSAEKAAQPQPLPAVQQITPTEQTPEAVAAAVNGAAGTEVVAAGTQAVVPWQ